MDFTEATSIVFNRIQKIEPECVIKIIGCLLYKDRSNQEMIRLALGPDKLIQEAINRAKIDLKLAPRSPSPPTSPPMCLRPEPAVNFVPKNLNFRYASLYPQIFGYLDQFHELQSQSQVPNQNQYVGFEDQMVEQVALGLKEIPSEYLGLRLGRRHSSISDFSVKTCHYFNKGYCTHGSNCKYLHGQSLPHSFSPALGSCLNNGSNDDQDQVFAPGSPEKLVKLELEIVDILKSKRGNPLSIASLPMVYLERYGRVIRADGYIAESQRHGKAGHSLTRLLSRLRRIALIDRPHGQHFIVLAEDAAKYFDIRNEKGENGLINSKSRQIYLTFPAESTFTEEDVANYFSTFGPVEDVRIPCQNRRMFGFVTFVDSDTVQMVLSKGNPHYICGARVLVKPYKEKSKLNDRKHQERLEPRFHHAQQYTDADSDIHSMPRVYGASTILQYQKFLEEREKLIETETRRMAELHFTRTNHHQTLICNTMDGLKVAQDISSLPSAQCFNCFVGVLNANSAENDKIRKAETNHPDQDSQIDLPESPFASATANTISNLI